MMCHDCKQHVWLGKACRIEGKPFFHIGDPAQPPNWKQPQFNQVIWKFLADHCSHHLDVRRDDDMTDDMFGYQAIGGDSSNDLTFDQFLSGWPGLDTSQQ
jgi:hypothetical protein